MLEGFFDLAAAFFQGFWLDVLPSGLVGSFEGLDCRRTEKKIKWAVFRY